MPRYWTPEEDLKLIDYVTRNGAFRWDDVAKNSGIKGKNASSCRRRWMDQLDPTILHGEFTRKEKRCIRKLHAKLGNKWSKIAGFLPRRTANAIKNYWNGRLRKRRSTANSTTTTTTIGGGGGAAPFHPPPTTTTTTIGDSGQFYLPATASGGVFTGATVAAAPLHPLDTASGGGVFPGAAFDSGQFSQPATASSGGVFTGAAFDSGQYNQPASGGGVFTAFDSGQFYQPATAAGSGAFTGATVAAAPFHPPDTTTGGGMFTGEGGGGADIYQHLGTFINLCGCDGRWGDSCLCGLID